MQDIYTADAQRNTRIMDKDWPAKLQRIGDFEDLFARISDPTMISKTEECIKSFISWFDYKGIIVPESLTMNTFGFLTIYLVRYHEDRFFSRIPNITMDVKEEMINLAYTMSDQFDRMIYVFRNDYSIELHRFNINLAEQIKIMSKPLIGKRFIESVRGFIDDLIAYSGMVTVRISQ